jgi:hypothetical protein
MTAKIIALRNQLPRSQEVVARPVSRHEAVRRVMAAARANGLGAQAVTEKNIAIVVEFNLFPESAQEQQYPPSAVWNCLLHNCNALPPSFGENSCGQQYGRGLCQGLSQERSRR